MLDINIMRLFDRQRPQLIDSLYADQPIQCKQCARRFQDGTSGKILLQEHLDEHFRINRRIKETKENGGGRGRWRSWFISIDVSLLVLPVTVSSNKTVIRILSMTLGMMSVIGKERSKLPMLVSLLAPHRETRPRIRRNVNETMNIAAA